VNWLRNFDMVHSYNSTATSIKLENMNGKTYLDL
jgi:hypothetical protein